MAGSAAFGGSELAEGFVPKGQRLVVQACHFRGRAAKAPVWRSASSPSPDRPVGNGPRSSRSPRPRARTRPACRGLGLDLTESGAAKSVDGW